jgi:hypothetical protein
MSEPKQAPLLGVTFSVAAERRLRQKLQSAAEFCRYCIESGGAIETDLMRKAKRVLEEIQGGKES